LITDLFERQINANINQTEVAKMMLTEVKKIAYQTERIEARGEQFAEIAELLRSIDGKLDEDTKVAATQATANLAASPAATKQKKPWLQRLFGGKFSVDCCDNMLKHISLIDKNVAIIKNILSKNYTKARSVAAGMAVAESTSVVAKRTSAGGSARTVYNATSLSGGAGGGGIGNDGDSAASAGGAGRDLEAKVKWAGRAVGYLSKKLMDAMDMNLMSVFDGIAHDSFKMTKNMRMIAYETRGWGENTQDVAKDWMYIGDQISKTGQLDSVWKNLIAREGQKGLTTELKYEGKKAVYRKRTVKDQQHMLQTAMHTSTMIGAGVEETADMFSEWQRNLKLGNVELDSMSESMKSIGRDAGMSGQSLLGVAKSSEKIFEQLRNSGALNASSMSNVTKLLALAKQQGSEEFFVEITSALSGFEGFIKSDPLLQGLISGAAGEADKGKKTSEAGLMDSIYAGNMTSSMKKMSIMLENMGKIALPRLKNYGVDKLEDLPAVLHRLDLGLADKKRFGDAKMQSDLAGQIRTSVLPSMHLDEKKVESLLAMIEQYKSPLEKQRELQSQKTEMLRAGKDTSGIELKITELQGEINRKKYMEGYVQSLKYAKDFPEVMRMANATADSNALLLPNEVFDEKNLKKVVGDLVKELQVRGTEHGVSGELQSALDKTQFKTFDQLLTGMQSKDLATAREAGSLYSELAQIVGLKDKKDNDPQAKFEQYLGEINSWLGKIVQNGIKISNIPVLNKIPGLNQLSIPGVQDMGLPEVAGSAVAATIGQFFSSTLGTLTTLYLGKKLFNWGKGAQVLSSGGSVGGEALASGLMGEENAVASGGRIAKATKFIVDGLNNAGIRIKNAGKSVVTTVSGATRSFVGERVGKLVGDSFGALKTFVGGTGSAIGSLAEGGKLGGIGQKISGSFRALRNVTKLIPPSLLKGVGFLGRRLPVLFGALSAMNTENWSKTWGKDVSQQTAAEQGGAAAANFVTGAIGSMTTGLIDAGKDLLVWGAELAGFKMPDWLKNFSLTDAIGLGPDGIWTRGFAEIGWLLGLGGEKIGEGLNVLWSYVNSWFNGNRSLDKKVEALKLSQKTTGAAQAHNDPTNPQFEAWKNYHGQEKKMSDDMAKLAQQRQLGNKTGFATSAQSVLQNALSSKDRMHQGHDTWSESVTAVKEGATAMGVPLDATTKGLLAALEGKIHKESMETHVRGEMMKAGYLPGANYKGTEVTKEDYDKHVTSEAERLMKGEGYAADGTKLDKAAESTIDLTKEALTPGSIYVHDIHTEKILDALASTLDPEATADTSYVGMGLFNYEQPGEAMGSAFAERLNSVTNQIDGIEAKSPIETTNDLLGVIIDILSGVPTKETTTIVISGGSLGFPGTIGESRMFSEHPNIFNDIDFANPIQMLSNAYDSYTSPDVFNSNAQALGLFNNDQAFEAMTSADQMSNNLWSQTIGMTDLLSSPLLKIPKEIQRVQEGDEYNTLERIFTYISKSIGSFFPVGMGLFDSSNSTEAMSEAYRVDENKFSLMNQNSNIMDTRLAMAEEQRYKEMIKPYANMQSMGLFDPNIGKDALNDSDNIYYQQMLMGNTGFLPGHPAITGLGTPLGATPESQRLRDILEKRQRRTEVNTINRGAFNEDSVKDTEYETIRSLTDLYGIDLNNLPGSSPSKSKYGANVSKSLYYTDDPYVSGSGSYAKGDVNTNLLTMEDAGHHVARMVEGEKPSGPTALLPGLDTLQDLIREGGEREEKMIQVLEQIRNQLRGQAYFSPSSGGSTLQPTVSTLSSSARPVVSGRANGIQDPTYSKKP
jgi:hypothetical protein